VVVAMIAFALSILLSGVQRFVVDQIPGGDELVGFLTLLQAAPAVMLFVSLYLLFYILTPKRYRLSSHCPKWPGPTFVTGWWVLTTALLPVALASLGGYDLTYGSLAGVMIALVFFFMIGLGLVIGAELNAALAETDAPSQEDVEAVVHEEAAHEAELKSEEKAVAETAREKT
jgi:membrane protein